MNRKIKLIILLIPIILLSTGCSASYKVYITNENIEEILDISENRNQFDKIAFEYKYGSLDNYSKCYDCQDNYVSKMKEYYVNNYYTNKDNFSRDNKTSTYNNSNGNYLFELNNKKEYSLKNNLLINNITKDSLIINDNNIILHLDNIPSNLVEKIDNVSIIVTTDLPVVSNNADSVEDNKYTWNFDKANYLIKSVSLYIERPKKEEDTKKNTTQRNNNSKSHGPAFTIIIMIGVYLAIIIAVINFFNKKKKLF